MQTGWIGPTAHVRSILTALGADTAPDGTFTVAPPQAFVFWLDSSEVIVPDDVVFYRAGKPVPLFPLLRDSPQGVVVSVIL